MQQLTQAALMREFNDKTREQFNPELFERDTHDIIDSIYNIVKSCERDRYFTLKLTNFEVIENYTDIMNALRKHEDEHKKKNDKSANIYDFIQIKDTDVMLIKLNWFIRHNDMERQEINGKTVEVINPSTNLEVLIAVPRFVRKYYFKISGNYYSAVFQIVDGSTYNNSTSSQSKVDTVTTKTMFTPIRVFRGFTEMEDLISGTKLKVIEYSAIIFNNSVNAIYYMLANFGLYGTFDFLDINCIYLTYYPVHDGGYVCFQKHNIFISTPTYAFAEPMVQSFVSTLYRAISKDTTINDLFDIRFWIKNLGAAFKNASIDKGLFVLDSIYGTYDNITKRDLHLPDEDKNDVLCLLRWILREFSALRAKENVDVRTKRIRIADYIGQCYATKLNKGMYRISDLGRRVTLAKVIQAVYTNPMFLISSISTMSNLISYRDKVNDNDASSALKFTYKGISGLGEDGGSIQDIYRYVDPTHIGILDLDSSSNSDPGMSGMICPMTKLYHDNSFSDYEEPNSWRNEWKNIKDKLKEGLEQPITFVNPELETNPYKDLREEVVKAELAINKLECPIMFTDLQIIDNCDIEWEPEETDSSSIFKSVEDSVKLKEED